MSDCRSSRKGSEVATPLELLGRRWDGDHCFAFDYLPGHGGAQDPRRVFVRAFKAGDMKADRTARELLINGLLERERSLLRCGRARLLVPIPGHLAGSAGPPLDRVCRDMAAALPWLLYRAGLLVRDRGVRQSSTNTSRPSIAEHLDSLRWTGGRIHCSVIIVDDVYTHGQTSNACRRLLADAGAAHVAVSCVAVTRL